MAAGDTMIKELTVHELLREPIVQLLMASDGVTAEDVVAAFMKAHRTKTRRRWAVEVHFAGNFGELMAADSR